jgi:diguanylate cyclase (GGDEF)-like protein/PAS domain S-box-containing protein
VSGDATGDAGLLAAEHEALMQFLYLAPVGLVQAGPDGDIVMINPVSAQLLMPLAKDGNLHNLFDALQDVAPGLRQLCALFAAPTGTICDGMHVHLQPGVQLRARGTGRRSPQVLSLSLMKLDATRIMAVLQDVSEQVRREQQLRQNDAWLSALLTSTTDYALVGLDRDGRVAGWNETICRVTGHSDTVVGSPYSVFYPADATTPEQVQDRLAEADRNGWSLDEGPRLRADGSQFWASALISPLPDRDVPEESTAAGEPAAAYCMVLRDMGDKRDTIGKRHKAEATDHLTGVANRRAFFEAAELELARSRTRPRPTALILLDADHFKDINGGHGHPGGDAVLGHLGRLLMATFRQVDIVARLGGDEFAVLLPSSTLEEAAALAEGLRALVDAQPAAFGGRPVALTVSIGVAVCDAEHLGLGALLKRAEHALDLAKARGRNRVETWTPALAPDAEPIARSENN